MMTAVRSGYEACYCFLLFLLLKPSGGGCRECGSVHRARLCVFPPSPKRLPLPSQPMKLPIISLLSISSNLLEARDGVEKRCRAQVGSAPTDLDRLLSVPNPGVGLIMDPPLAIRPLCGSMFRVPPCFSADGDVVVVACGRELLVLAVATGERITKLRGHEGAVSCLAFDADGMLYSGSHDGT
jgi:hypothetical protein